MSNCGAVIGIFLACALGVPAPEEITLLSAGVLVSTKQLPLGLAVISGLAGIFMSDSTLFFLGRRLGPRVFGLPLIRTVLTESRVKWAESRIRRNGPLVCFIGRFLPGLRVVIFTTSGALGIKPQVFLAIDVLAAMTIVSLWISLGNWMGSNFIDTTQYVQEIKAVSIFIAPLVILTNIGLRLIVREGTDIRRSAKRILQSSVVHAFKYVMKILDSTRCFEYINKIFDLLNSWYWDHIWIGRRTRKRRN